MKVVKLVDVSFTKKDNQIKLETSDKIKVKEYIKNENKEFDEELSFEIKYFLLKEKYDVLQKKIKIIKELIGLFAFLIAYIYYYLSLESCLRGEEICSSLFEWQMIKIYQSRIKIMFF